MSVTIQTDCSLECSAKLRRIDIIPLQIGTKTPWRLEGYMSFDGHERPFPRWIPYFFGGLIAAGGLAYFMLR